MTLLQDPAIDFAKFFDKSHLLEVKKGTIMQLDGADCPNFLLVKSGTVRVYALSGDSRENTLYRISKDETCVITTSCLLSERPYPAIAEAESDVEIRFMPKAKFHALYDESPEFRNKLLQLLSHRIGVLVDTISVLGTFSIEQRLTTRLLKENSLVIHATHQQLADDIGSSREVVSRQLKRMEKAGYLKVQRGTIELINLR
ncbi:Crp/Fnr family transcriptional regulator [Glaciecola sp. 1036]|uniref:Crp/Fnr family transcriptional regulator n=1 Tax=Alteromonadaceae TaxID=72275 RepID=UPI003D040FF7